ncbi:MAG: nucleotide exchange factor GrpE [Candidatus Blackburnbacteria bacterium RIFCSPHIGHO2_02_FULL_39_13]|uniref:Protein GrpE n=1 Tax=Candidatus Blackburnbacteria bacterium RIFCSPLOWO2_01_FULL_40_20 TaxID=1797519 RepID=A0A1G1VB07_9BACT|nr:MAG: Protein GrpE [Microgenomates group bacterium GW2011_GWA2_39_19]OGY07450.1 MAG: nucleotide exchange factor GrpE [Candidatus Blackburnbacteria bacterium RIFCSPHIGHO2_01_FULL_40_17]OGY08450.1 MAG: nucleotide exchange factor GrpE [Candidatus Blackburnbacteria bacterium RIFCSPHIGHO2_02_FULL_39_13]OGY12625.1 MAG: nucleotide exchange factor GrpE [Candidatus Blackburnbacteria bacterium RIFCSPLOWO2_01_FULL_40_20]OGY14912.1 MAG: nucleotide exchange factor GrpE [Candidatus Blackburnbacteria bacter
MAKIKKDKQTPLRPDLIGATEGQEEELKQRLARALADYDNLLKRTNKERQEIVFRATKTLIEDLLPVIDNLERAQTHLKDQGLEIAIAQLAQVFERYGVREIPTKTGDEVDAEIHEVLDIIEGKDKGKVTKVISKGYQWNDGGVIRPTKVQAFSKESLEDKENHE